MMRFTRWTAAALVFCACASTTPQSRIRANQAEFSQYPKQVQDKIRAGQVDNGFTPEMVLLALGKPERRRTNASDKGPSETWTYRQMITAPAMNVALGAGGAPGVEGYGAGVGGNEQENIERTRVTFLNGLVSGVTSVIAP